MVGVIRRERIPAFERVLWRACHHTAYVRASDIEEQLEDPETVSSGCYGEESVSSFRGERVRGMKSRIRHPESPAVGVQFIQSYLEMEKWKIRLFSITDQSYELACESKRDPWPKLHTSLFPSYAAPVKPIWTDICNLKLK